MKRVEIESIDDRNISLVIENFPVAYVNAIRRLILSDVPTMAVDLVEFYDNSTDVYDEMIAHRLGLLVLRSEEALSKYGSPEICRDVEPPNSQCFAEFSLDFSVGEDESGVYVKASDLKLSDPAISPVYPETPIAYVAPQQRLHFVAYARLGRGKEHAKWSPATISALRYTPFVTFKRGITKECLNCLSAYPRLVKAIEDGEGRLELWEEVNTGALRYCAETACKGYISIEYSKERLRLKVEGTGALRPERIIYEAIRILEDKIKRFRESVSEALVKKNEGAN